MDHIREQWRRLAARSDPHSIGNLDPADYQYIAFYDLKEIEDIRSAVHAASMPGFGETSGAFFDVGDHHILDQFDDMQRDIAHQGWHGRWFERGGCDHCGAPNIRYVDAYRHIPTGDIIVVGSTCTGKVGLPNRNEYEIAAAKQREETRKANAEREAKRVKWRAEHPDQAAVVDLVAAAVAAGQGNSFWSSILSGIKQYGAPTDRQAEALVRSWEEAQARKMEQENPVQTVTVPCPTGAQTIQGTILSTRTQESMYGTVEKCLVLDHRGFKVWGTIPGRASWSKGDEVRFVATIEPSDDDPTFGFFKRPRLMEERDQNGHWQKAAGLFDAEDD